MEPGNVVTKKSVFTAKNVIRVLALLCVVFVFCPAFLVSCSGQTVNVGVMDAVKGMSYYGETIVEPQPAMLICLLIPIAIFLLPFIKALAEKKNAVIIAILAAGDFIIWLKMKSSAKQVAEQNYCTFKATTWYYLDLIALALIVVVALLIFFNILTMEEDIIAAFTGNDKQRVLDQMSATMNQMTSAVSQIADNVASNVSGSVGGRPQRAKADTIGYCAKCGSPIPYGSKFCISCGTPVPESMIAEAEAAKKAAEEAEAARRAAEEAEAARRAAEAEAARKAAEEAEAARRAAEEAEAARRAAEQAEAAGQAGNVQSQAEESAGAGRFCQQCGARLEPGARFCMSCGTKVE
jgi:uncharacterized Zn finger protein (UPF0148 family)